MRLLQFYFILYLFFSKVFDTWAKIQSGILLGNLQNPGLFTECINFHYEPEDLNVETIQGQHCMVTIIARDNVTFAPPDENFFDWREM